MHFDDILKQYLGEFGRYQKIQYILVCLPTIFTALHALSWTFTGAKMNHRCPYPGEVDPPYSYENYSWINDATNLINDEDKKPCARLAGLNFSDPLPNANDSNIRIERCPDFVWNTSLMEVSAVRRWKLTCDDSVLRGVIQSMYYVGQFFGSLILGPLSDKIGRKKVFFIAIMIQIVCGAIMSWVPWWPLFAILRIGVGFSHPGIFMIAVVIGMELVGPSRRMLGGVASGLFFATGQVILGVLAFFIRDYQHYQLAISLPALVFISYWWIVPESARWLMSQRRFVDADRILQRAAKINKRTLPANWYELLDVEDTPAAGSKEVKKGFRGAVEAYKSLFRTPNIRKRSLLSSCICWPAVSMVYYGLAMNPGFMGGDNRLAFIVGGLLEFPSLIIVLVTINIVGRKFLCLVGFLLAGACLFLTMIVLRVDPTASTALMVLVVIGKSALTGVYAILYIFTPELFPTTVRSTAMGLCSMIARVGAVAASYIALYLADVNKIAACSIFAVMATAAGFACIFLPETAGQPLPETIEEAEHFGKHLPMFKFLEKKKPPGAAANEPAGQELLMKSWQQAPVEPNLQVSADVAPVDKGTKEA